MMRPRNELQARVVRGPRWVGWFAAGVAVAALHAPVQQVAIAAVETRVGGAQCVPSDYFFDRDGSSLSSIWRNEDDGFTYDPSLLLCETGEGAPEVCTPDVAIVAIPSDGTTRFAHCPTGGHAGANNIVLQRADLKYQDRSATLCLTCLWYATTTNGSTFFSDFRHSDGGAGLSCDPSFVGFGTMTWSSFSFGAVPDIAQIGAFCIMPSGSPSFGGAHRIRSYAVTTDVGFLPPTP